jgi:hypothetical protein
MKKEIECFLLIFFCCSLCRAQQVVSSGGFSVKSEISVDWILGGSLSDIPIQDISILNKLQMEQLKESEISLKVYPIPVTDFINIEITPIDTSQLILELFNNSGVKLFSKKVVNQPILQVNISNIPSGVYFLKVLTSLKDQQFRTEKIIKN